MTLRPGDRLAPHVPLLGGIPGPCLQCCLDAWVTRAVHGARLGASYRPGQTNWAVRPVRPAYVVVGAST